MAAPRVLLFGYDELLLAASDVVLEAGGEIVAVVFPSTRRDDWRVDRVRAEVTARGLAVLEQPGRNGATTFAKGLEALAPDLALAWSYPMIIPPAVLAIPPLGCLNLHMGLLPAYRGPSALQWAIANGEEATGVTLHYMDEGLDTGPLIARARVRIDPDDDVTSVLRETRRAGIHLLQEGWQHFSARRVPSRPQDEARARYFPHRTADDDRINWSSSAVSVRNLVRATTAPFAGAHTTWRGATMIVRGCQVDARPVTDSPGSIRHVAGHGVLVATGRGSVLLTRMEKDGTMLTPAQFAAIGGNAGQSFE